MMDHSYIWGLRYVDDLICSSNENEVFYVLQDANWNIVALTSNVVQERYTYSSFGKLNVFDASFTPKTASTYNLTRSLTGQVLDNETGLMLYRNRIYHPTLGRFLQRDPIGYQGNDENLYRYVRNTSILSKDLYGLQISVADCFQLGGGTAVSVACQQLPQKPKPSPQKPKKPAADINCPDEGSGTVTCVRELAVLMCWSNCKNEYEGKIDKFFFLTTADVEYLGIGLTYKSCEDFYNNVWHDLVNPPPMIV
jgi:RHS repeat-associated protein